MDERGGVTQTRPCHLRRSGRIRSLDAPRQPTSSTEHQTGGLSSRCSAQIATGRFRCPVNPTIHPSRTSGPVNRTATDTATTERRRPTSSSGSGRSPPLNSRSTGSTTVQPGSSQDNIPHSLIAVDYSQALSSPVALVEPVEYCLASLYQDAIRLTRESPDNDGWLAYLNLAIRNKEAHIEPKFYRKAMKKDVLINSDGVCEIRGAVYEINSKDCGQKYAGETYRPLEDRIKEHLRGIRDCNEHNGPLSVHGRKDHGEKALTSKLQSKRYTNGYKKEN
uniref:Uncharacterized protein n=1 Tax=Ascaris lumbricoides TaxID=6252 RepID=A0A9J2PUT5_ASCLU